MNKMGWEGVHIIASKLTKLERLWINNNKEIGLSIVVLGRLPILKNLFVGTCEPMQRTTE